MKREDLKNVAISFVLALIIALLFYLASIQIGGYDSVDVQGGTFYTFVLSLIISLAVVPRITSSIQKKKSGA